MNTIALALGTFIDHHKAGLLSLPEEKMTFKPSLLKWSRKEIIGHTIDSAQNNIRRFIVAQYEDNPAIEYNQDKWVTLSNYQEWNTRELVELWYLLTKQLVEVLKNTPEALAQRPCQEG